MACVKGTESGDNGTRAQINMNPSSEKDNDTDDLSADAEILERGVWANRFEFYLSTLGYSIGLSSVVRFPFLCFKHGGGTFLFPYFLFLILGGIPLVFMELSLGQYTSLGPTMIWKAVPLFRGVGIAMVLVCAVVSIYHNVLIAWCFFYLFDSMQSVLPWTTCDNDWNTEACCVDRFFMENCSVIAGGEHNISCLLCLNIHNNGTNASRIIESFIRDDTTGISPTGNLTTPVAEYFHHHALNLSESPSELGGVQWFLCLCLLATWLLVFLCLIRGIKSSGKVVFVTVLLPFAILLVLLVQSARLEGAKEGIIFFLKPNWSRLSDLTVWKDAASQVIFSLGACFGGMVLLGSFNKFDHYCYKSALAIPFISSMTSIFAGFVVFTTLGNLSVKTGFPIENIAEAGVDFTFIIYPEALSNLQGPVAMAILFFLMLVMIGINNQVILVHTFIQALVDEFPQLLKKGKTLVLLITCCIFYLLGLPLTTRAGLFFIEILDTYSTDWPVLIIGLLESLVFAWIYGYKKVASDIWTMIGKRPGKWWRFMWQFITPIIMLFISVVTIMFPIREGYKDYALPTSSQTAGRVLAGLILLPIPICMVIYITRAEGSIKKRFKASLKPAPDWGPKWQVDECLWTIPEYMRSEKEDHNPYRRYISFDESASMAGSYRAGGHHMGQEGDNIDTGSIAWSEDENKIRGNWAGRYDGLISLIGYSVGIGNVWRFPYLVYKNGGGAFFIPYLIILFLVGLPLFFLELAFGQFASCGPLTVWRASPIFKGVGYASLVTLFFVCTYYNVINAWSVFYLFSSMQSELPWATCNNTWNTDKCRIRSEMNLYYLNCSEAENETDRFGMTIRPQFDNGSVYTSPLMEQHNCVNVTEYRSHLYNTPSYEYFFNAVLQLGDGIEVIGVPRWPLALCLLFCWLVTFLSLIKGVKSAGKVVYITVGFPYVVLLVLLIRYATLDPEAYLNGLKYYVTPQWERLGDATVWGDAASQMFFSLGLSQGGLIALSSYNRFHYDCYRDAYIVCLVDTLTSVFAGFVIFAILGVMAKESGVEVDQVVESSFALAYVAYPEAVTKLPGSTVWAILFFLMLFSLAVDSEFLMVESIIVTIVDEYPNKLAKKRIWVISALCSLMFLLGLPLVCSNGMYILVLMDDYSAAWSPLIVGVCMCIAIAWVYKAEHFQANIKAMVESEPKFYWKLMWKYVTPFMLLSILVFRWVKYKAPTLDGYVYPTWAHVLALLLSLAAPVCIPLYAILQVIKSMRKCSLSSSLLKQKITPDTDWGPALDKHRNATFLPGVTPQEKINSISEWIEKGQIFVTDTSGKSNTKAHRGLAGSSDSGNDNASHDAEDNNSVALSGASASKSVATDHSDSSEISKQRVGGVDQTRANRLPPDRLPNWKRAKGKNPEKPRQKKRETNTKGYNVTFPDDSRAHKTSDMNDAGKKKEAVTMCDQETQTPESYLKDANTISSPHPVLQESVPGNECNEYSEADADDISLHEELTSL